MKKVCRCLSCKRETAVKLISYGGGYIGICSLPDCKKLAYTGEDYKKDYHLLRKE